MPVMQTQCLVSARHTVNISGMNENELEREAERLFMDYRLMKACSRPALRGWGLN